MVRNTATEERTTPAASSGEEEIRALVDAWSKALEAKDIEALTAGYAPDAVLFDVKPPYRVRGVGAIRRVWEEYLPCLPAKFTSERRDFVVTAGGDAAFVHCLHHIRPIGEGSGGPDTWIRVTVCYHRIGGTWRVVHEHVSLPFDPRSGQVSFITDPE
ncbi:MAG: YybH family protein [Xanthobacteraceae bacterium]